MRVGSTEYEAAKREMERRGMMRELRELHKAEVGLVDYMLGPERKYVPVAKRKELTWRDRIFIWTISNALRFSNLLMRALSSLL